MTSEVPEPEDDAATADLAILGAVVCEETDTGGNVALFYAIARACASHALYYVATVALSASVEAALAAGEDPAAMVETMAEPILISLVRAQRIADALHFRRCIGLDGSRLRGSERSTRAREALEILRRPTVLPGQAFAFFWTERNIDATTLLDAMRNIRRVASWLRADLRADWAGKAALRYLRTQNRRVRDSVLARLFFHADALGRGRWVREARRSDAPAAFLRVLYDTSFLTTTLVVGGQVFRRRCVGLVRLAELIGAGPLMTRPREEHALPRWIAWLAYTSVAEAYDQEVPDGRGGAAEVLYDLLLREVLDLPEARRALSSLGPRPTLVVSTHGALVHISVSALWDGEGAMIDRFDIAHASPLGDPSTLQNAFSFPDLFGGAPCSAPLTIRCAVDQIHLEQGQVEQETYAALKVAGLPISADLGRTWGAEDLRGMLAEPGVALLSCHVGADPTDARTARMLLPDGSKPTVRSLFAGGVRSDLLVFAGCNSASQTDWLGGDASNVAALAREAGAASVVTTLWPIDDLAGRVFNTALAEGLASGLTRVAAHSAAQRAVRAFRPTLLQREGLERDALGRAARPFEGAALSDPYYWAAFALSGAWR